MRHPIKILSFISLIILSIHCPEHGLSQLISHDYYGEYSFIYRQVDSILNKNLLASNKISKINVQSTLDEKIKIGYTSYYGKNGVLIKTNAKKARTYPKLTGKFYWVTSFKRKTKNKSEFSTIDSIVNNQVLCRKIDGISEKYMYDIEGHLSMIHIDYEGISTAPRVKQIFFDYNPYGKLIKEKIIWLAGDSTIVNHAYKNDILIKSTFYKYYNEHVHVGNNQYIWRISEVPIIEVFVYQYLQTGLIDNIAIKDSYPTRKMTFEYE